MSEGDWKKKVKIPRGYKELKIGETLQIDDRFTWDKSIDQTSISTWSTVANGNHLHIYEPSNALVIRLIPKVDVLIEDIIIPEIQVKAEWRLA